MAFQLLYIALATREKTSCSGRNVVKLTFIVQISAGQKVARSAAEEITNMTMELGRKSLPIVFDCLNSEDGVDGAVIATFPGIGTSVQ